MARTFNRSQVNSAISRMRSSANELRRLGSKLQAAGRELEREGSRAQAKLRQIPRTSTPPPRVTTSERTFLDSIREHVANDPVDHPHDVFLSHATPDLALARQLHSEMQELGAEVWMDDFSIRLGHNIVRAIDRGISLARIGIVLVTPAVIAGRYWVEREFSALLNTKETVIPVLHEVTWEELAHYSPMLHLNKGLSTKDHSVAEIAQLVVGTLVE